MTFLDTLETKSRGLQQVYRHMVKRPDLSVVIFDSEGHISLISSNSRSALNELGGKNRLDYEERDCDYLLELCRPSGKFIPTIYQAHVSTKELKSSIKTINTKNDVVNILRCDHTLTKKTIRDGKFGKSRSRKMDKIGSQIKPSKI